jgi:hypothetical protein
MPINLASDWSVQASDRARKALMRLNTYGTIDVKG